MAPTFVQTGIGQTDASGVWTAGSANYMPALMTVGNIVILQVLQDGSTSGAVTVTGVGASLEDISGTGSALTYLGEFPVGGSSEAIQHIWIGRAAQSSRSPTVSGDNSTSEDLYMRLYEFTDANAGTALSDVIENGSAGIAQNEAGTSSTINDCDVITLGADRLALNFVAVNDDNALDAFTGQSGGTWAEAVAEYADSAGTDGAIGLQIATIASATTIGGGSDSMAASDAWGVVGFALKPAASGTAHSLTPSDTITLSEAIGSKAVGMTKTDTVTLQEATSRAWAALRSAADTLTLSDAAGKKVTLPRADSFTLTDLAGKAVALPRADTITLSDATSRVWAATRALADTVTLTDARSKAIGLPRADTLTLSDVITPVILLLLQFNDTITLSDAPAKAVGKPRADTLTLSDQLTRAWAAVRAQSDTLTLSDAVGKGIRQALADTIASSDALGKADKISRADAISLADAIARASGLSRADTLTLTDALARGVTIPRADTIVLSDAQGKAFGLFRADSITLSDFADVVLDNGTGNQTRNLADTVVLADDFILALNGQFITGDGQALRTILLNRFGIY